MSNFPDPQGDLPVNPPTPPDPVMAAPAADQATIDAAAKSAATAAKEEEKAKPKSWGEIIRASRTFFISVAIHAVFALVAAYLIVQSVQANRKLNFDSGKPTVNPTHRSVEHRVSVAKKKKTGAAPPEAKRIVAAGISDISLPDMPTLSSADSMSRTMRGGMGGAGAGFGLGLGSGTGLGAGKGMGGGGGRMSFFGFRSPAQSVVFVIDISGSMVSGSKDRDSYSRLEKEAFQAINGLDPVSRVNVIAFSKEAYTYNPRMMLANLNEKRRICDWLKTYSPILVLPPGQKSGTFDVWASGKGARHGGTSSNTALEAAFLLSPGMIFFVSDGEPTDVPTYQILKNVEEWQAKASRKVIINAIAYRADAGEDFMRKLAESNGGEFKNIP